MRSSRLWDVQKWQLSRATRVRDTKDKESCGKGWRKDAEFLFVVQSIFVKLGESFCFSFGRFLKFLFPFPPFHVSVAKKPNHSQGELDQAEEEIERKRIHQGKGTAVKDRKDRKEKKQMKEDKDKEADDERKKQQDEEREKQLEDQRKRQQDDERKKQLEDQRQRQLEDERKKLLEDQRQRQLEDERKKQLEDERKKQLQDEKRKAAGNRQKKEDG